MKDIGWSKLAARNKNGSVNGVERSRILVDPLYESLEIKDDEVFAVYQEVLSSFELRRTAWQMQSGLLFEVYPGCTHNRRAHAIGCWMLGNYSLDDIKVMNAKNEEISLREWIANIGEKKCSHVDYLLSLMLHDIGHPPFSHTLEINPFYTLNHEEITRSLVKGSAEGETNWYAILEHLLTIYKMKNVEDLQDEREYIQNYNYTRENEVSTVHRALKKYHGKCININSIVNILRENNSDLLFSTLHRLVNSQVDIDRIDHFLRDSYYSGVKFAGYRARDLLQNLLIVPSNTPLYQEICDTLKRGKKAPAKSPTSYLMIKEDGKEYAEYLLIAREFIYHKVLWHPKNLMLIGALNMAVKMLIRYEPVLSVVIPFITDQILLQMFREKKFSNTTVEGYEKVTRGELSDFEKKMDVIVGQPSTAKEKIKEIYEAIEKYNSKIPKHPKVIIFSNIEKEKRRKENVWLRDVILEKEFLPLRKSENEKKLYDWLVNRAQKRKNRVIIWTAPKIDLKKVLGKELFEYLDRGEEID